MCWPTFQISIYYYLTCLFQTVWTRVIMGKSLPCKQVLYSDYNRHAPYYILNRERSMFGLLTWLALSHCHLHRSKPSWVSEGICDDIHFGACECSFWCILNLISNIQTKPRRASLDKETERREKERQKEEGKIGVLRRRERERAKTCLCWNSPHQVPTQPVLPETSPAHAITHCKQVGPITTEHPGTVHAWFLTKHHDQRWTL